MLTRSKIAWPRNPVAENGPYACLELFSGIGGFAVAAGRLGWQVSRTIDINQQAAQVYWKNFDHDHQIRTIESIPFDEFASVGADLWWMSPPCQPFTQRGAKRDIADTRCEAFMHVVKAIASVKPPIVAMENVPGFRDSSAAHALRTTLEASGYRHVEWELCPTEFGVPNRRRRFYLVATLHGITVPTRSEQACRPLQQFLDSGSATPDLFVPETEASQFASAIDCVATNDKLAIASCFTSAYGKSPAQSGSYLRSHDGLRRFSPREILRLLGFPADFQLPPELTLRQQWKLVGNSLSIPAVEYCLLAATQRRSSSS